MAQKTERHAAVLALIGSHHVGSQEELRSLLDKRGISVTQATLSRDLRELGVVRVPGGGLYANPGSWLDAPAFLRVTPERLELCRWSGSAEGDRIDAFDRLPEKALAEP